MEIDQKIPTSMAGRFDTIKVGLCQVYTEAWAIEANLNRTLEAIESAARQGAEIAVTPESVLQGYVDHTPDITREQFLARSEPLDGERMQKIRDLVKQLNIHLVFGFAERDSRNEIHNSAALISSDGKILGVYRKIHCRPFEDSHHEGLFSPGDTFQVNRLQFGDRSVMSGTMICFDREIPESVRCLRALGAEIIFCPLATDTVDMSQAPVSVDNEMVTRVRAAENEVFIVVVNHAGRFNGGSFVVGPEGEVLHQMGHEAGVQVVDVPVGAVSARFHNQPLGEMGWGYRRPAVYEKYLK